MRREVWAGPDLLTTAAREDGPTRGDGSPPAPSGAEVRDDSHDTAGQQRPHEFVELRM